MMMTARNLHKKVDSHSHLLLLVGLGVIGARNWHAWQQDQVLADKLCAGHTQDPELHRTPKVSVLVAAWNEEKNIDAHIKSFLELDYPAIELVMCAGGTDNTFFRAQRYASKQVRILEQYPGEGKHKAIKRCFEQSSGEIIYLTDADCLFDKKALELLLVEIVNNGEQVVTGRFSPLLALRSHPFVVNQWAVDTYARAHTGPYISGLIGRNAALTRTALGQSGAFGDEVPIGTDYYLACCLLARGYQIRYIHSSIVPTEYHTRVRPYLRQQTRWLRNVVIHGRRFGADKEVKSALHSCSIGLIAITMPLVAPFAGPIVLVLWLLGLFYGTANRLRYLSFAAKCRQETNQTAHLTAPAYVLLDLFVLAYAMVDITWRKQNRW